MLVDLCFTPGEEDEQADQSTDNNHNYNYVAWYKV